MPPEKAQWTILTYIAAHNNLEQMGRNSLDQILKTGSTSKVKLAALYDGPTQAARYIAGEGGSTAASAKLTVEEPLGDFDSGDPGALLETARWAFGQCPAEKYGLVLWSHGTGWRPEEIQQVAAQARGDAQVNPNEAQERAAAPGSLSIFRSTLKEILQKQKPAERAILFDDGSGHSLDTLELGDLTGKLQQAIGQPLDLLGMDACLMATLEVAYQVRHAVRYLVASQELVPGFSWPYDTIYGKLAATPGQPAAELAAAIVQEYTAFYTANPPAAGDVTKVALDLANSGAISQAVDHLGTALQADMDNQADVLWKAQWEAYLQESNNKKRDPNKFRFHQWDIRSLAQRLSTGSTNVAVQEAAQDAVEALKPGGEGVLAEGHAGAWFDGIGGVSIYLVPPKRQQISPYYASLELAKDTCWDEMLAAYHDFFGEG